jgi:hypothetical protein
MKKSMDLKLHTKKIVLKHSILYVHWVDLLIWNLTQFDFPFYEFSVIHCDFFKTAVGVIWSVLQSLEGDIDSFIGRGLCNPTPIGEGMI